jgi:hypothetical protein
VTETQQVAPAPDQPPKDLIGFLDFYLVKKAPFQIPEGGREWIVKYGPWITIVLLVLMLPPLLLALGLGAVILPFAAAAAPGIGISLIGVIVEIGLTIAALPGLFARKISGWNMLFYAQIVGLVVSLLSLSIVSGLIGALISLYILFQVRTKYAA